MTSRRQFLQAASAAAILSPTLLRGGSDKLGRLLPQRELGKTGHKVTAFGLGGHHVGVNKDEKLAQALIERALERGVRFFDNAVNYDSFLINVQPKLAEQNIGLLAMKSMVFGRIFKRADELGPDVITPKNLHEFVYSQPVSCMLSGCETVEQVDQNTAILENYQGMDEKRRTELVAAVKPICGPDLEFYKNKV